LTTPFELRLESELTAEFARFSNQWLFPWHFLNDADHIVDVDDFHGGRIRVGGIVFQGQIQQIYWQTVSRYLDQKIHATFVEWEQTSREHSPETKRQALEGVEHLLRFFVGRIVNQATDTDRALRGRGNPASVEAYNSTGAHSGANAKIHRLKEAHLRLIAPVTQIGAPTRSLRQRLEHWYAENKFLTWCIGLGLTVLGIFAKALLF
jgi:hypothetical protein